MHSNKCQNIYLLSKLNYTIINIFRISCNLQASNAEYFKRLLREFLILTRTNNPHDSSDKKDMKLASIYSTQSFIIFHTASVFGIRKSQTKC